MSNYIDESDRKITKIARSAALFVRRGLTGTGLGSSEIDFIHAIRKNPGIRLNDLALLLNEDKGTLSRRAKSLEAKGFVEIVKDEKDGRVRHLYPTPKAEEAKEGKELLESRFYAYLLEDLDPERKEIFLSVLDELYQKSKTEGKSGFPHLKEE